MRCARFTMFGLCAGEPPRSACSWKTFNHEERCAPAVHPGMFSGMTVTKIAISLPEDAVARVREAVRKGRAASASAYIADAIRERVTRDDLAGMLDEMLSETGGPLTARERRSLDAELGVTERRARRG